MNKRLEEIKDRYMELEYDFNLRKEDIEWLIEQAEKAERHKKAIKECVERMNEGGAGTRSFVYERLIEVLEEESK